MMNDAKVVAEKLLQVNAIKLSPQQPFTWASGWKSPIYCDNRSVLSYPFVRDFIKSEMCNILFSEFTEADMIAGVATAGIPWGAMAADQLKLPFIYVRPKPKEHGLGNQIEGWYEAGQKVVVIEDLVSTGKSSLQAVDALIAAGVEETGLKTVRLKKPITVTYHSYDMGTHHMLKESHWYQMKGKNSEKLVAQSEEGIQDIQWVNKEDLPRYAEMAYPSIADVLAFV